MDLAVRVSKASEEGSHLHSAEDLVVLMEVVEDQELLTQFKTRPSVSINHQGVTMRKLANLKAQAVPVAL
jgi:hypothetical protein